jgi:hypothetical protein
VKRLCGWVEVLVRSNVEKGLFSPGLFEKTCRERMLSVAVRAEWAPFWLKRLVPVGIKRIVKRLLFTGRR